MFMQDELEEALVNRVLRLEDVGWKRLDAWSDGANDTGLPLGDLKELSTQLRELTASQPMFRRGAQLRNAYIFGRGMSYLNVDRPRYQEILTNPHNEQTLFSVEAYEVANTALFADGVFSVMRERSTNKFTVLPLNQIGGVITNPFDAMDIWYVQRSWSANGRDMNVWFPTSRRRREKPQEKTISDGNGNTIHIDHSHVVYMKHANRQSGWTFGVPDSFPALLWALSYAGYLQDSAKLVHALSKFAWQITSPSKAAAERAKTHVMNASAGVGAAAIGGGDISSVGVPSAQVNFNSGQPLAAMVAASFGVPVIALLSSPGATGGSYGAAQTLDAPTLKGFEVLQNSWASFFREILVDIGAKEGRVEFSAIENDAPYRQISSLAQAVELGLVHNDEAREMVIDLLDIPVMHDNLPVPPSEPEQNTGSVVAKQGAPAKGAAQTKDNPTNHDNDDR